MREDDPKKLLSGEAFQAAGINGAVESDVLKTLYESLIDRQERHGLGEYYTPDWLAAKIVKRLIDRPLVETVLDPACGSGTFLFHTIRRFLDEAKESDMKPEFMAPEVCARVEGMDIHPVAVIIARVTYLLALAPALLERRGSLSIPVYLGDALQLSISEIIGGKELTIMVPPPPAGQAASGTPDANGREQLEFPRYVLSRPSPFRQGDRADAQRVRSGDDAEPGRGGAHPHH